MSKAMSWMMVTATAFGLFGGRALAGQTNSPGPTNSTLSMMWTLNDIYNVLDTRTTNVTKHASFKEPDAGPAPTMHTLNDIMTLVTNRAPAPKSGQTITYPSANYAVGDDGTYRIGVAWPTNRFTAIGGPNTAETNQIRDNLTGLIWARNANLASNVTGLAWTTQTGTCQWYQAFDVITNSAGPVNGTLGNDGRGYGGTNDWRLPNIRELLSLVDDSKVSPALPSGHPFANVIAFYWSSTTWPFNGNSGYAWSLGVGSSDAMIASKTTVAPIVTGYVWPVRGGK